MAKKIVLSDEVMDQISGGVLPDGWEQLADSMAPQMKAQYPDMSYEEACAMLAQFFDDPADIAAISEYMRKYF